MSDIGDQEPGPNDIDVVVVGSGMAGMAAALEAAAAGASVLLVEGAPILGGSSRLSNGIMMAAGTSLQRASGLEDSPDELFQDYLLANQWNVVPSLVRRLVDELPDTFEWIQDLGVLFAPDLIPAGEERVPRGHAVVGQGQGIVDVLSRHVTRNPNIDIALGQRVDRLLVEDGTVVGVASGDDVIRAGAVVLATGGFGGNPELWDRYLPLAAANDAAWYIAGEVPDAGDIFKLVEPVNAYIDGVDRGGWVLCADFNRDPQAYLPGWLVLVNRSGRRFMDEMAPYSVVDPIVRGQGNRVFAVFDHAAKTSATADSIKAATKVNLEGVVRSHWLEEVLDEQIEAGKVKVGATLEDLAEKLGIEPENLTGTIERYNDDTRRGHDSLFLKDGAHMVPVAQAPFYGCELRLSLIALTACGPAIDPDARVLDNGQAHVRGLFAAGECTGGTIGSLYLGSGNSIANCLVYGRIAGRNAAGLARGAADATAASTDSDAAQAPVPA
ncbi:FAD-dependent oxidoreductase [Parafrankia sp. EUN1f]|uniref:FAD-dependent oxidoreductase n=1 Tax=Parafrankia sp. EUN1f TaxID=102897 RepID=UPI0001C47794|nr:FAD-dependent oxidoreductase [Parafrankia sp. EUN1f]EFC86815.1 fumarate reductase/succinate dehydrogenase flavoprotein domain protein [Parafrankia sp. EUN1f]